MKLAKYNSIQFESIHLLRRLTTAEELITGKHKNLKAKLNTIKYNKKRKGDTGKDKKMRHNKIQLKTKR
jgi:hypothetical protein